MVIGSDFKGADVEQTRDMIVQPSGLELNDGAKGKLAEGVLGFECNRMDQGANKAVSSNLKPKSTWTRIN